MEKENQEAVAKAREATDILYTSLKKEQQTPVNIHVYSYHKGKEKLEVEPSGKR